MGTVGHGTSIDDLIDRAVAAINCGDRASATMLAGQVLAVDSGNADAEDLLTAPGDAGEIRRLTILVADLVDSTRLSTRVEPETYRAMVGRYREMVPRIVDRYEGHIAWTQGDGVLAVFGHPTAHENDVRRAVLAGLDIARDVAKLNEQAQRQFGIGVAVRVGVHRGLVYLDTAADDVYGSGANVAARVSALASPGTVVVSEVVASLVGNDFELEAQPPAAVKGIDELVAHHRVLGEKAVTSHRAGLGPLVNRSHERARLQKRWARAQAGTLKTPGVILRGEPGIGKSRLAAAAAELVAGSGAVVLELFGSPFHTDAGLHPVRTFLERRCDIGRLTGPAERLRLLHAEVAARGLEPVDVVPLLAPVLGVGPEAGYRPVPAEGRKLYELIAKAVQAYLLACLGGEPGLIVAEDVHWFDQSTIEVLGALMGSADGRLLVVVTGRPGGWLPDGWPAKVFDVEPFTDEHSDALILALDPTVTADERAAVRDRCDGVPFYIEQVVGALGMTRANAPDVPTVPEALYEPLFARLRACANAVPVVVAAGIIGRHVDRSLLGAVCTLSEADIDDAIDELEDARVLERWGADGWRFRHELLREVGAELAPPSVRRDLHARVANALVGGQAGDPDWGLAADHYRRAERFDDAASAYQQASAVARRRGALAEARTYLSVALACLERSAAGPDRDRREIAVRLERGLLAAAAELYTSRVVAADFERCLELGGSDLRDDELVATLLALVSYYAIRADLRRMAQVLESLSAGLDESRQWFRPAIEASFGVLAWLRGEFDVAREYLKEATAARAATSHPIEAVWYLPNEPIASAHLHLALTCLLSGDLTGAEAELVQAERRAEELGFPQGPFMTDYARFVESWIRIEAGQLDRAAVLAASLTEHAERHGFDQWCFVGATQQGAVDAFSLRAAHDPDCAAHTQHLGTMTALLDTWRALGLNIYLTFYDSAVGRLLIAAGRLDQARRDLDAALQLTQDTGMRFYDAELLRLRAHTHTDLAARRADFGAAVDLARRQGATLFELRAALDDFELHGEPARSALIDAAGRMPADSRLPEWIRVQNILQRT